MIRWHLLSCGWHVTVQSAKMNAQAGTQVSGGRAGRGRPAQGDLASWPLPTKQGAGPRFSNSSECDQVSPQVSLKTWPEGPKVPLEKHTNPLSRAQKGERMDKSRLGLRCTPTTLGTKTCLQFWNPRMKGPIPLQPGRRQVG